MYAQNSGERPLYRPATLFDLSDKLEAFIEGDKPSLDEPTPDERRRVESPVRSWFARPAAVQLTDLRGLRRTGADRMAFRAYLEDTAAPMATRRSIVVGLVDLKHGSFSDITRVRAE